MPVPRRRRRREAAPTLDLTAQFGPRSHRLALETRILFDGAAAVAGADALGGDAGDPAAYAPQDRDEQGSPPQFMPFDAPAPGPLSGEPDIAIDAPDDADGSAAFTASEHSVLNAAGADTAALSGWVLSGTVEPDQTFTVTVTVSESLWCLLVLDRGGERPGAGR